MHMHMLLKAVVLLIINDNKTKTSLLIIAVLLLINTAIAFAEPIPAKPGTNTYVFDYAGLITGADEQEIKRQLN